MNVTVTKADLPYVRDEGTVLVFTGTAENGDRVDFGADHRPAWALYEGVLETGEAEAEVESYQVLRTVPLRCGRVAKTSTRTSSGNTEAVARYLPANYRVTGEDDQWVYFQGHDNAGWTMEDYVLPRLASGLHFAEEVHDA